MALLRPKTKCGNLWITRRWNIELNAYNLWTLLGWTEKCNRERERTVVGQGAMWVLQGVGAASLRGAVRGRPYRQDPTLLRIPTPHICSSFRPTLTMSTTTSLGYWDTAIPSIRNSNATTYWRLPSSAETLKTTTVPTRSHIYKCFADNFTIWMLAQESQWWDTAQDIWIL